MSRIAMIVDGSDLVNCVLLAEGMKGDEFLAARPDAVEVTGMDPMPMLGTGWTFVGGQFVPPPVDSEE